MIESVSLGSQIMQQSTGGRPSSPTQSLTTSQRNTISATLEKYDSGNLSSEDATAIVEAFKSAGIKPSDELQEAMGAQGFDAAEVGSLAGVGGGMPPPPPPPTKEEESAVSSLLDTLLSIDEDEDDSTYGSTFNEVMEYTSRILNLNDSSKNQVMDMLDKYSSNDSGYSQEAVSNIIKNSLNQILSDENNYNRISFYG